MKVADVMTADVITVRPDTPFKSVAEALLAHDVSGLPVVDEQGRLVGIVSEADLLSKEAYAGRRRRRLVGFFLDVLAAREVGWLDKASGLTAADVMTTSPLTATPDEDVHVVARRMLERRVKRLPVVEDGRLVGIASRHDLLRYFHRSDENMKRAVEDYLRHALFVPPDHDIRASVAEGVVTLEGTVLYKRDTAVVVAVVQSIDGVVGVQARLLYREEDPSPSRSP